MHKRVRSGCWHIDCSVLLKKCVIYLYFCCGQIPLCHHFPQNYPTVGRFAWNIKQPPDSEVCMSSQLALPGHALFLRGYIYTYISRPGNQLSLFYQDPVCSDSDLSFLQQPLPCGLRVVTLALLRFMVRVVDGKCMLSLSSLLHNTWFLFSQF